jgi:hypothetical protein
LTLNADFGKGAGISGYCRNKDYHLFERKKMKRAVMLLVTLVFCLPGYGTVRNHGILVYRGGYIYEDASLSGVSDPNDPMSCEWSYNKIVMKAYWIIDANYSNQGLVHFDTIKQVMCRSDKSYGIFNGTNNFNLVQIVQPDSKTQTLSVDKWIIESIFVDEGEMTLLSGKVKTRDIGIGLDNKRPAAVSIQGWMLLDETKAGTVVGVIMQGKISLSLDTGWTKRANDDVKGFNSNITDFLSKDPNDNRQGLIEWLEAKGYIDE